MFDQVIETLKKVEADPAWAAFVQRNGTIPLQAVATNECSGELYKVIAESLLSAGANTVRGGRSLEDWMKLDELSQGAAFKLANLAFKEQGFELVRFPIGKRQRYIHPSQPTWEADRKLAIQQRGYEPDYDGDTVFEAGNTVIAIKTKHGLLLVE